MGSQGVWRPGWCGTSCIEQVLYFCFSAHIIYLGGMLRCCFAAKLKKLLAGYKTFPASE